jgi:hypothetical protein
MADEGRENPRPEARQTLHDPDTRSTELPSVEARQGDRQRLTMRVLATSLALAVAAIMVIMVGVYWYG